MEAVSWIYRDPDEWETVVEIRPCTGCIDGKCTSRCNGSGSIGERRRSDAEVEAIKTARRLREEDLILRRAEAIRAARP